MATRFTSQLVDGTPRLHFDEIGSGPPLIFLHGIGGNRTNWTAQQLAMADVCTAIAWDARGYGKSDDYEGPLNFHDFSPSADLSFPLEGLSNLKSLQRLFSGCGYRNFGARRWDSGLFLG